MENKFPKNVRQIGNVSDTPKIYVEDYVDTFLNQICDKADKEQAGAFLVGKKEVTEGQECLYIFGAICMEFSDDENEIISQENFEKAEQEKKEYFEDGTMIGWMLCRPGVRMVIDTKIFNTHEKYFSEKNTIFILKDNAEVEEQYYCYKYKELMQIGGHYVYYEKNAAMQSYMITARKKIGVTPSEVVEDKAAKDFRNLVKERFEAQEQKKTSRLTYGVAKYTTASVRIVAPSDTAILTAPLANPTMAPIAIMPPTITNKIFTSILYSYFTSRTSASPSAFITRYLLIPKTGITSFISYSVVPSNCFTPSLE